MNQTNINILTYLVSQQGENDTLQFILDLKKLSKQKIQSVVRAIGRGDVTGALALFQRESTVESTPSTRVQWMLLTKAKLSKTEAKAELYNELEKLISGKIPSPGRIALDRWIDQLMATPHASTVMRAAMTISERP